MAEYEGWAILELMGHRRLGGYVREVELFGSKMCRIDVPDAKNPTKELATQFYGGGAIYCCTPATEAAARQVAELSQPAPVQPWELPHRLGPVQHHGIDVFARAHQVKDREDDAGEEKLDDKDAGGLPW